MGHPFEMWADRIAAASEDELRPLVTEARVLRARSLSDQGALRRATYALSQIHHRLGEREQAVHEAKQLLSLCQTPPIASREEIEATRGWIRALGEHAPKVVTPPQERSWADRPGRERPERPSRERPDRPERAERPRPEREAPASGGPAKVRALAREGRWAEALAAVGDKGAGAELARTAIRLQLALASADPLHAVSSIRDELHTQLGLTAPPVSDDPLSRLLGAPVSARRAERIDAIEAWAEAHPDRMDELAASSLRHHLGTAGPSAPAPWLAGIVARGLVAGGGQTEAALNELRAAHSVAVAVYDEWPFSRLQRLLARASVEQLPVTGVRRGVLARHEPDDRKLWTMRMGDRMLAVAPHAGAPYPANGKEDLVVEIADRLKALCGATLLLATGSGNEGLRSAARARGVAVLDRDGDDAEVLAELGRIPAEVRAPAPAAEAATPAAPVDRLEDLLAADPIDVDRLRGAVASLRRADRALRIAQRLTLSDEALAVLLEAVAAAIGNDRPIPEGTTLALRAGPGPRTREVLRDPRFGGAGVDELADIARVVADAGWDVHRVLRGPTRREMERHPALDALASGLSGLWRLLVREGNRKGEVWFVPELGAEGRAAVPLLLLEDWQRVIVSGTAPPPELGAGVIQWSADSGPAVLSALAAFVARAEPAGDDTGSEASAG